MHRVMRSTLAEVLSQEYQTTKNEEVATMSVKFVSLGTARAEALRQKDAALGTVVENKLLTSPNAPAKRHIGQCHSTQFCQSGLIQEASRVRFAGRNDLQSRRLSRSVSVTPICRSQSDTYRRLLSLPANSESIVRRALARFGLSAEQEASAWIHALNVEIHIEGFHSLD